MMPAGCAPVRILVADDSPINRKIAVLQLQKLGFEADVAANGREAVDAVARNRYELVLMDCDMPELDGFEATTAIRRADNGTRHTVIVAMTASAFQADREKCVAAGMDDYIAKPAKSEVLRELLHRWLGAAPQA